MPLAISAPNELCSVALALSPRANLAVTVVTPPASPGAIARTGKLASCPMAGVVTDRATIHVKEDTNLCGFILDPFGNGGGRSAHSYVTSVRLCLARRCSRRLYQFAKARGGESSPFSHPFLSLVDSGRAESARTHVNARLSHLADAVTSVRNAFAGIGGKTPTAVL